MKYVAEADKKGTMMKYMLTKLWKLATERIDPNSDDEVSKEGMSIHLWMHVYLEG